MLRNKVEIKVPPEAVWPFISDPEELMKWNGGIRAIVPVSAGAWTAGARWRLRYEFHGRESNYLAEALEFEKPARLVIHLTGGVNGYMQEIYELSPSEKGMVLKCSIVLSGSGIYFLFGRVRFLLRHIFRPRHKRYLLKLKELAERGSWDVRRIRQYLYPCI